MPPYIPPYFYKYVPTSLIYMVRVGIGAHKIDSSDRSDRYEGVEQAHLCVIS